MKTMVSAIICLTSNKNVILPDEPALGFDVLMHAAFNELLEESCRGRPRIFVVSTHIPEEIADTTQKLLILDNGRLCFFNTLRAVETKTFCVSGLKKDADAVTQGLHVIGRVTTGGLAASYIFDDPRRRGRAWRFGRCLCRNSLSKW